MKISKEDISVLMRVYELVDPSDLLKTPRYVGITSETIEKRLKRHIYSARRNKKTHKDKWICSLLSIGSAPIAILIEEIVGLTASVEREKFWIAKYKSESINLTNSTDGGEGTIGRVVSEETRGKISEAHLGKTLSEEHKLKISLAEKGKMNSEEAREKMRGRIVSQELRDRIRVGNVGKVRSEETRKKISIATSGENHPNWGKRMSEETKEKIRTSKRNNINNK